MVRNGNQRPEKCEDGLLRLTEGDVADEDTAALAWRHPGGIGEGVVEARRRPTKKRIR